MSEAFLDSIWCLERVDVISLLEKVGVEHDGCGGGYHCSCDEDELKGLLYSFCASVPDVDRLLEIAGIFNESFDLVRALMDSSSGRLTHEVVAQLVESKDVLFSAVEVSRSTGVAALPDEIDCRSILVACEVPGDEDNKSSSLVTQVRLSQPGLSSQTQSGLQSIKPRLPFGMTDVYIKGHRSLKCSDSEVLSAVPQDLQYQQRVLITSPTFRYASALDCMYDRLYFGWEGKWTNELESSLFELLVAVDDDLVSMVKSWVGMLGAVTASGADDMNHMLQCVTKDVQDALNNHSAQAIGRLHQTLVQFTDTGSMSMSMMQVPEVFVRATNDFMQAKLTASEPTAMLRDLTKLVTAAEGYLEELTSTQQAPPTSVTNMIQCAKVCIGVYTANCTNAAADSLAAAGSDSLPLVTLELAQLIYNLKPQGMNMITKSSISNWSPHKIDVTPMLPLECIANPFRLHSCMQQLSETLVMDAISIGSVMGYTLNDNNVAESAAIIASLMEVGIAYVTSESGKLMGLLPMERSLLVLHYPANSDQEMSSRQTNNVWVDTSAATQSTTNATAVTPGSTGTNVPFVIPSALRKRSKDMLRVFRNNVKQPLLLRLNTNFELAIQKLHEHHGSDCWVGLALQKVWKCMMQTSPPQLLIFELWYGEEMIAADFAHPVCNGRSVYVATRFNDRSAQYRNLMPGFMLALVVTKYLQEHGCCVWDLGTVNL
eukprot:gene20416-23189_t